MAQSSRNLIWFFVGLAVGALLGGVAGYVINDLTSRENPEVVEEMRQDEQRQIDLESALQQLGSDPVPVDHGDASATDEPDASQPPSERIE